MTTLRTTFEPELRTALDGRAGSGNKIASIDRRPSEYRTSYVLEEVDVHFEDGQILELVAKNLSRSALTDIASNAKPAFLGNPLREIETYRTILDPLVSGPPKYYGAEINPASDCYWLYIERIAGVELYQIGNFEIWEEVARWLARFHSSRLVESVAQSDSSLIKYDRKLVATWPERAFLFSQNWPAEARRSILWLAERYESVIEMLCSLPTTIIHGEFYASNILVVEATEQTRVAPVDWEMSAIGPGLIDLAALTAGSWSEPQRIALARAYYQNSRSESTFEQLLEGLACCRLHLAMQWLGWSDRWTPPREHTQDWLGEALRIAQELNL